jgi:hypothetical protein
MYVGMVRGALSVKESCLSDAYWVTYEDLKVMAGRAACRPC